MPIMGAVPLSTFFPISYARVESSALRKKTNSVEIHQSKVTPEQSEAPLTPLMGLMTQV